MNYIAAQPVVAATGNNLNKYLTANPTRELGEQDKQVFEFMTRLAEAHPSYAYISYGVSDGGYVGWPNDDTFANYDPRQRPWYQLALANPARPCALHLTTGHPATWCRSVWYARWATHWAAWAAS